MFTHPDRIGQLAGEHHHQMLAQASKRQLRHQHGRPAARTRIIGRLAAAIARAGAVTAQAPGVAQDRSSGLHGPALPDMGFRNGASSNFSPDIVSESGSTNFIEDLVSATGRGRGR